jgi:3-methyl-2-oxobutanoate hydroxymethyltransferase
MTYTTEYKKITIKTLLDMKHKQEKIAMLTCYDASFSSLMNKCLVDVLLVGDSLGNVIQGHSTTLPVSINDMIYHTLCVSRVNSRAFILVDMPFGTFDNPQNAYTNAVKIMQAGAHMVKIEGGAWSADIVKYLSSRSIPVCSHLGLTPQSVHVFGGFNKRATNKVEALELEKEAQILQESGTQMLLFEAIPSELAQKVTQNSKVPTIGIGAGKNCDGQVLVLQDILGLSTKAPSFSKNYLSEDKQNYTIEAAIKSYVQEVKQQIFP